MHSEVPQPAPRLVWQLERFVQLEAPPLRLLPVQGLFNRLSALLLWFCRIFGVRARHRSGKQSGGVLRPRRGHSCVAAVLEDFRRRSDVRAASLFTRTPDRVLKRKKTIH